MSESKLVCEIISTSLAKVAAQGPVCLSLCGTFNGVDGVSTSVYKEPLGVSKMLDASDSGNK